MGSRGPAPKPHEMRVIEGGAGKGGRDLSHRPPKNVPKFAPLADEAPDWMPREGRAEWRRLVKEFARLMGGPLKVDAPDRGVDADGIWQPVGIGVERREGDSLQREVGTAIARCGLREQGEGGRDGDERDRREEDRGPASASG